MAEDTMQMRTRAALKSCLKVTPPITPERSVASSPCTSGRTSPSIMSDSGSSVGSGGRKTVSFCSDDELEEVFWADEWDRSPAAVTPKLSYQFASTASHTPSKWKNRSEPQRPGIDPDILPYLDAVPIRLLPLLPQSLAQSEPPAAPDPHPQTPTPTASPETRPTIKPPSEPPELRIEPPVPTVASPPPSTAPRKPNFSFLPLLPVQDPPPIPVIISSAPTPPRRKLNMTFLPVNAIPEAQSPSSIQDVSVNTSSMPVPSGVVMWAGAPLPSSSSSVTGTDPSPDAGQLTSTTSESDLKSLTPTTSTTSDVSPPMSPPGLSLSLPVAPVVPFNAESDTDTETDTYTDTDGDSDAPSVSTRGSSLSSPPCDYESDNALDDLKLDAELVPPGCYPRMPRDSDLGSYFPPVTALVDRPAQDVLTHVIIAQPYSTQPGQTPPLSVLYPSPQSQAQPLLPPDVQSVSASQTSFEKLETPMVPFSVEPDAVAPLPVLPSHPILPSLAEDSSQPTTPLSTTLRRKLMLEALPSPTLVPPSPFELEPNSIRGGPKAVAKNGVEVTEISLSGVAGKVGEKLEGLDLAELSRPDATPRLRTLIANSDASTPDGSPLLTVENVRASWDAHARASIVAGTGVVISPSLSRRRMS
ncbi:hypothetical protein C8Q74DRAFT_1215322 [Fomes fomentarius]|nr:hypothetical protein C8Q74DRAFT_1215322 [Fomes fomentarius]